MSYATVQAGYAAVIRKISGYDTANVLEGDFRVMGHGKTSMVVLSPGPFRQAEATIRNAHLMTWQTFIALYVLYKGEPNTTLAALITERQKIIDEINKWPFLDGVSGVMYSLVLDGGEVEKDEGSQFYRQVMIGETREMLTFTRSE